MTAPAPGGERPTLPPGLLDALRADPVHAPETLALMAVERTGKEAAAWVAATRAANPGIGPGTLSTMIRRRFVSLSQYTGAAGGALGLPGSMVDAVLSAWTQARMIVHLAAAHGLDPTDRERAAEILYFTGVHKVMSAAEQAVDIAAGRRRVRAREAGNSSARLVWALSRLLGRRLVRRALTRFIPGVSIPLGWWGNGRATRHLADRAVRVYAHRIGVDLGGEVEELPPSRLSPGSAGPKALPGPEQG